MELVTYVPCCDCILNWQIWHALCPALIWVVTEWSKVQDCRKINSVLKERGKNEGKWGKLQLHVCTCAHTQTLPSGVLNNSNVLFTPSCFCFSLMSVINTLLCFSENTENWGCFNDANDGCNAYDGGTCSGELLSLNYESQWITVNTRR